MIVNPWRIKYSFYYNSIDRNESNEINVKIYNFPLL